MLEVGTIFTYPGMTGQNVSNRPARRPVSPETPRKPRRSLSPVRVAASVARSSNKCNISDPHRASDGASNRLPSFTIFNPLDSPSDKSQLQVRTESIAQKSPASNIPAPSCSSAVSQRSNTTTDNVGLASSNTNAVSKHGYSTHSKTSAVDLSSSSNEHNAPRSDTFHLSDLSETTLEAICRDNWVAPDVNTLDTQKRSDIDAEYRLKQQEFALKRDAAIDKAKEEYANAMTQTDSQKGAKLNATDFETAEREKKHKIFMSSFSQLKVRRRLYHFYPFWFITCLAVSSFGMLNG